ncbi:MAG: 5'-nucleotidase C-terminal domain-containing protein [Candidatus Melainabacteria bacterium]|nr:5'-nucleotidase C-terminal domain-containing protein [Candidatus Melainabacteria bacterium]
MRISKIKFLIWATLISICLLITVGGTSAQVGEPPRPNLLLTILHTNDLHAHDEPFEEYGRQVGGMARIGYLIRAIRKDRSNVLVIDAGDIFQGTTFYKVYHGEVEVALLNQAGYDIYTVGNHEFDNGPENLAKQLKSARFDIISANLDGSSVPALQDCIKPSVVKVVDGQRVGFVGVITPDLQKDSLNLNGVHIKGVGRTLAWIDPIAAEVNLLKAHGINKIILVTHVGLELDRQLAAMLPDVDAIIGGHSHTRLNKPIIVNHSDGSSTVIVQTGCYGRALGKLELAFDVHGKVILSQTRSKLININQAIPEAPDIKAYLMERAQPLRKLQERVVGVALDDFDNRFSRYPWDCPMGNLICDALADSGSAYGAAISFHNRGGIRARIERGLINLEKVEEVLPFDNHLVFATVPGGTILKALEHSVSGTLGGHFLDVHGLKIAYNPNKPPGSRIAFALVQAPDGQWNRLDEQSTYKVALNDYNFSGGEGYDFSTSTDMQATKQRLALVLAQYLAKHQKVKPRGPSRIVPITDGLLEVVSENGQPYLQLKCLIPEQSVILVVGDGLGVEPIADSIPVPLNHPVIRETRFPTKGYKTSLNSLQHKTAHPGRTNPRPQVAAMQPKETNDKALQVSQPHEATYRWKLPLTDNNGERTGLPSTRKRQWASVIIHPQRQSGNARVIIAAPVNLTTGSNVTGNVPAP